MPCLCSTLVRVSPCLNDATSSNCSVAFVQCAFLSSAPRVDWSNRVPWQPFPLVRLPFQKARMRVLVRRTGSNGRICFNGVDVVVEQDFATCATLGRCEAALVATKRNPHRFEFLGFRVHGPSSKGGCRSRSRPVRHVQAISLMDTRIMGEELLWASSLGCDAWRWRQRGSILRWGMANRSFACLPQHNITDGMK